MIELRELELVWQRDVESNRLSVDEKALTRVIQKQTNNFERKIKVRDYLEIGVGIFVVCAFISVPFSNTENVSWHERWEWFVLALGCLFVTVAMLYHRRQMRSFKVSGVEDLLETTQLSLKQVEYQLKIMGSITWWYVCPIALPLILVVLRDEHYAGHRLEYFVFCMLVMVASILINLGYCRWKLKPQQQSLQQLCSSLT